MTSKKGEALPNSFGALFFLEKSLHREGKVSPLVTDEVLFFTKKTIKRRSP